MDRTIQGQRRARRRFMGRHFARAAGFAAAAAVIGGIGVLIGVTDGESATEGAIGLGATTIIPLGLSAGHMRSAIEGRRIRRGPYMMMTASDTARFEQVRAWFVALDVPEHENTRDALERAYSIVWSRAMSRTADRCAYVLDAAGRYRVGDEHDPVWLGVDRLCGIVGGAADVALAVLARDILDPRDYETLVGWARAAGVPIPGEMHVGRYADGSPMISKI